MTAWTGTHSFRTGVSIVTACGLRKIRNGVSVRPQSQSGNAISEPEKIGSNRLVERGWSSPEKKSPTLDPPLRALHRLFRKISGYGSGWWRTQSVSNQSLRVFPANREKNREIVGKPGAEP